MIIINISNMNAAVLPKGKKNIIQNILNSIYKHMYLCAFVIQT